MISELPRVVPATGEAPTGPGPDHPMRAVTRQVAFEPEGWSRERREKVGALFDDLAPEWHTRRRPEHRDAVADALVRGLAGAPSPPTNRPSLCVEVGSGTGFATGLLTDRFDRVLAADLSIEMLMRAPRRAAHRVQADAAQLPVPDASVDAAVLVNSLLFPAELDRALAPSGAVVWVNTSGAATPIHLSAADVGMALPGSWDGVAAHAGWATWCVQWRSAAARDARSRNRET